MKKYSFYLGILLTPWLGWAATCEILKEPLDQAFCRGLSEAQAIEQCQASDDGSLPICLALKDLLAGGSCEALQKEQPVAYLICGKILLGLNYTFLLASEKKFYFSAISQSENNFHDFGVYLEREHPLFVKKRFQALLRKRLEPLVKDATWFFKESYFQTYQLSVKIIEHLLSDSNLRYILKYQNPIKDWLNELASTVQFIEKYKVQLLEKSKEENRFVFYSEKSPFLDGFPKIPLQVTPDGKIYIHFSLAFNNKELIRPQKGSFKQRWLAIEYHDLRLRSVAVPVKKTTLEEALAEFNREYRVHKFFENFPKVSDSGILASIPYVISEEEIELPMVIQKYYEYDLEQFISTAMTSAKNTFEGRNLDLIRVDLVQNMLESLTHLNEAGFYHRDVKSENFLVEIDSQGKPTAFLTDFGLTYDFQNRDEFKMGDAIRGTLLYHPPELLSSWHENLKAPSESENKLKNNYDAWSLGWTIHLLVTGMNELCPSITDDADFKKKLIGIKTYQDLDRLFETNVIFHHKENTKNLGKLMYQLLSPTLDGAEKRISLRSALDEITKIKSDLNKNPDPGFGFRTKKLGTGQEEMSAVSFALQRLILNEFNRVME